MKKASINKHYEKKYRKGILNVIIGIVIIALCTCLFLGNFGRIMLPYIAIGGGISIFGIWIDLKLKNRD